jgi:hypothetical protein
MSDHDSTVLTARLTSLADELTPSADPIAQVRAARSRYRRQRRNRVVASGLLAAAAALAIGVPPAIGSFSAVERGEVAGPGGTVPSESVQTPPEKTPGPPPVGEDAGKSSRWTDMLDERAERDARLQPVAERLAAAFAARPTPLSLFGPPQDGTCPSWMPDLKTDFGVPIDGPQGALPTGCRWSAPDAVVVLAFVPGMTPEELGRDASAEATRDGCYIQAMPNVAYLAPLMLCEQEGAMDWRFETVDDSGIGVWRLTVTLADGYSGDGATVLAHLADVAGGSW